VLGAASPRGVLGSASRCGVLGGPSGRGVATLRAQRAEDPAPEAPRSPRPQAAEHRLFTI